MKPLDIRDISIIDALPTYCCRGLTEDSWRTILNVGCGEGRIDWHLSAMGFQVYSTDIIKPKNTDGLNFSEANIFDLKSFPIPSASVVICSQVLEHLKGLKRAVRNLLMLAEIRLIITVPRLKSYNSPHHIWHWDDLSIWEFEKWCLPYSVAITKIRTKPEDVKRKQWCYLIVVDKRQCYG